MPAHSEGQTLHGSLVARRQSFNARDVHRRQVLSTLSGAVEPSFVPARRTVTSKRVGSATSAETRSRGTTVAPGGLETTMANDSSHDQTNGLASELTKAGRRNFERRRWRRHEREGPLARVPQHSRSAEGGRARWFVQRCGFRMLAAPVAISPGAIPQGWPISGLARDDANTLKRGARRQSSVWGRPTWPRTFKPPSRVRRALRFSAHRKARNWVSRIATRVRRLPQI
jgi:hypothetical protein